MKELIIYIGQSSICIGIFFLIYRIFLRSCTSFHFNRLFLLIGLIASFIIPTVHFTYEVVLPVSISSLDELSTTKPVSETTEINIWLLLSIIYLIGITIQLLRNLTSYRKLFKLIKSGSITEINQYKVIDSPQVKSPFTVLNCIAINTMNMNETEKDIILKHEITHISQKHWIDLLCSECALLLQWFNPLMWLYVSSQKENHEFLADKAVLDTGISPAVYQAALINQRFQGPVFSFANSFNYPNQLNRLFMIKKAKTSPWRRIAALALIPSFGLFFWASATPRYTFIPLEQNNNKQQKEPAKDSIRITGYTTNGNEPIKVIGTVKNNVNASDAEQALYIIDGKESSSEELKAIDPKNIESISVLKDKSATELYGEKGKNGVIIITMKNEASKSSKIIHITTIPSTQRTEETQDATEKVSPQKDESLKISNIKVNASPIFVIDGKEVNKDIFQAIDPEKIEQVEVFKDEKAVALYGTRARDGVVIVTLKK